MGLWGGGQELGPDGKGVSLGQGRLLTQDQTSEIVNAAPSSQAAPGPGQEGVVCILHPLLSPAPPQEPEGSQPLGWQRLTLPGAP